MAFTIKPILVSIFLKNKIKEKIIFTFTGLGNLYLRYKILYKFLFINLFNFHIKNNSKFIIFFHNKDDKLLFDDKNLAKNYRIINGSGLNLKSRKNNKTIKSIKNKKLKVVIITRFIFEKGIYDIIDLIFYNKIFTSIFYDFHLYGGEINNLNSEYQNKFNFLLKNKYLNFHGFDKNIASKLDKFDVLLHLSHREGCSNVILEALNSGVFPISYNVPGCANLIPSGYGILAQNLDEIRNIFLEKDILKKNILDYKRLNKEEFLNKFSKKKINSEYLSLIL